MKLRDLLNLEFLQLPARWDDAPSFLGFVEKRFNDYLNSLESLDSCDAANRINSRLPKIRAACTGLQDSINHFLKGSLFKGYREFEKNGQGVSS